MKWVLSGAFVATVWAANWALTTFGVITILPGLKAPAGVVFAGLGFILRDAVHEVAGRLWVIGAILAGAALSFWVGADVTIPGGHVPIAVASACAFLLSEMADFGVYSPLREKTLPGAVAASQVVGATADSLLFLWLAFGSAALFWGQFVGKTLVMLPFVAGLMAYRNLNREAVAA